MNHSIEKFQKIILTKDHYEFSNNGLILCEYDNWFIKNELYNFLEIVLKVPEKKFYYFKKDVQKNLRKALKNGF
jgi:hypothetical protein